MYDPIVDDNTTMTSAAKRAGEERSYAALGKEVAEQSRLDTYAAPLTEKAWAEGQVAGAAGLLQAIRAQRAQLAQTMQPQAPQNAGLADYLQTQEEMA
jgi:hypothetical protein